MADNDTRYDPSTQPSAVPIGSDDVGGVRFQVMKEAWGADGVMTRVDDVNGSRVPVGGAQIGLLTESAPATDTATSGLNGRLQRIAQRLTTTITSGLIALAGEATASVTIAVGTAISAAFDRGGYRSLMVILPATYDGTSMSFQVSDTLGGTYVPLNDFYGNPVTLPVVAASNAYFLPGELSAARFIKLVASTNQLTTDTIMTVVLRS